jgi:hypothetical protein
LFCRFSVEATISVIVKKIKIKKIIYTHGYLYPNSLTQFSLFQLILFFFQNMVLLHGSAPTALGVAIRTFLLLTLYPSAEAGMRDLDLPNDLRECYNRAQNYSTQQYVGGLYCWYCEVPVRAHIKGYDPNGLTPEQEK